MASRTVTSGTKQTLVLNVTEGLYVLRYLGGVDPRSAPSALVKVPSAEAVDLDVITAPGFDAGEMPGPGSNLVLVVRTAGSIEVEVQSVGENGSLDARFSLDLLAPALTRMRTHPEQRTLLKSSAAVRQVVSGGDDGAYKSIELFAHVARRGDIAADEEGWVAGPKAPSAIEGIEVLCTRSDVGITIQYRNTSNPNTWSDWQAPGTFVGTRQKASPLTGLRLKVIGAAASLFELEVEALFLGSATVVGRGRELEFVSAGGLDPLVGLRMGLMQLSAASASSDMRKAPRVRVFRSYAD